MVLVLQWRYFAIAWKSEIGREPLVETIRFIDVPPQSRNEDLAAFMRRINICEERGSGIDKVVDSVEIFRLPALLF